MTNREIEEFASTLIRDVRDPAIRASDANLLPEARWPVAKRWRNSGIEPDAARELIADTVDEVIFRLLHAIDNGRLKIKFLGKDGGEVDLSQEGYSELAGSYGATGGWCAQYSNERFSDDCADFVKPPN
jgi:hypothetical protein